MKTNYELALEEYNNGSKELDRNDYDRAMTHLLNAQLFIDMETEKENPDTETLLLASRIYIELINEKKENFNKSIKHALKALNKKEENMERIILEQLATNYFAKGYGNELDIKSLKKSYNYLKQIKKPNINDYQHLIKLMNILEKPEKELNELLDNALEIDKEAEIADTLQEEDMLEQAIEYTIKATEKYPGTQWPHQTLAMIFLDETKKENTPIEQQALMINNAYKAIKKAYDIQTTNPSVLAQLIIILENHKRITNETKEELHDYYQELEKIDPDKRYENFIDNALNDNI